MTAPAVVATKSPSTFEDIVDVFYAPTAVFTRRRNAGFGLAFLIYVVLSAVMFYAARPVLRPMFEQQMAKQVEKVQANPDLSPEQKESMSAKMRGMADSPLTLIGPIIAMPVALFLVGLALWIAGKTVGSAASYGQAMMVATFSFFPRLLITVIMTAYAIATGRELTSQYALGLNPVALLPDGTSSMVTAAVSRLDVGILWTTVLLGIGIAVVGRIPRSKGLIAAALVWLVGGLLLLGSAAMQG